MLVQLIETCLHEVSVFVAFYFMWVVLLTWLNSLYGLNVDTKHSELQFPGLKHYFKTLLTTYLNGLGHT